MYTLTRLWVIRGLGFIYFVAYLILWNQGEAMFHSRGLLPMNPFIDQVIERFGSSAWAAFWQAPSLFYFVDADVAIRVFAVLGILGGLTLMAGFANLPILAGLWLLQLSLVNSGQLFFGYGWQMQLCEFTFLCFFIVPLFKPNLKTSTYEPSPVAIWAMRWMLFRLMFGAGMIKIRGDECWRDFTCLIYHYETQPNPHPLSYFYHQMPAVFHYAGVLFNHFVELIVPFGLLATHRIRRAAGLLTALFQVILILSGNLAWLNWLTLLMCVPCFNNSDFERFYAFVGARAPKLTVIPSARGLKLWGSRALNATLAAALIYLSVPPALNLIRSDQAMNTSYGRWHPVNSYGAFGSVGKGRGQIVISGTDDEVITPQTQWREYQFKCSPGDVSRRPCLITPYHYHLDWQIWFSGMRPELQEDWLFRLAVRLLQDDPLARGLFAAHPFENQPPKFIKMDLYRYRFTGFPAWPEKWWRRDFLKPYMPPVSLDTPLVERFR